MDAEKNGCNSREGKQKLRRDQRRKREGVNTEHPPHGYMCVLPSNFSAMVAPMFIAIKYHV